MGLVIQVGHQASPQNPLVRLPCVAGGHRTMLHQLLTHRLRHAARRRLKWAAASWQEFLGGATAACSLPSLHIS
jgi:hypothetical protein